MPSMCSPHCSAQVTMFKNVKWNGQDFQRMVYSLKSLGDNILSKSSYTCFRITFHP